MWGKDPPPDGYSRTLVSRRGWDALLLFPPFARSPFGRVKDCLVTVGVTPVGFPSRTEVTDQKTPVFLNRTPSNTVRGSRTGLTSLLFYHGVGVNTIRERGVLVPKVIGGRL